MGSYDNSDQQEQEACISLQSDYEDAYRMRDFKVYETKANYYIVGRDEHKTFWKVLKINRLDPFELDITEDSAKYSKVECTELLQRINCGNQNNGGLKFRDKCYGIVGFVKFLGPYYMLLITRRRKIGMICGHPIYAIDKSELYPIPNSDFVFNKAYSDREQRYVKFFTSVDLTKDFFFSYSYRIQLSLQKNQTNYDPGIPLYETMFVWNEFLTRGIRNQLNNTLWTVALVHGFFQQVKLSVPGGREFWLTVIARRSRHYAGTRYLKRGVNEKGRVANDVESEQIVVEDVNEACPVHMTSAVQVRGSIPLFWSQEASFLNIKPDIILTKEDQTYSATKLHFDNLVKRYGSPVVILSLIKTHERKPRESILREEFSNAIEYLNKGHLIFLPCDMKKMISKDSQATLKTLTDLCSYALQYTGFFYCQTIPTSGNEESSYCTYSSRSIGDITVKDNLDMRSGDDKFLVEVDGKSNNTGVNYCFKSPRLQKGVLRTNCVDCLDRTNVAQYAFGLVAVGLQLQALGLINTPSIIDPNVKPIYQYLIDSLMLIYEKMGDTLAFQYGGSAAHNKIFSEKRGHCKATRQSKELLRSMQRYWSNNYMDRDKQNAINLFLGHFLPQLGKPSLWELDSDQHYNLGRHGPVLLNRNSRWKMQRSLSDGNILREKRKPCLENANVEQSQDSNLPSVNNIHGSENGLSELSSEMSTSERDISYSRYMASMSSQKPFQIQPDIGSGGIGFPEQGESFNCSNFLDVIQHKKTNFLDVEWLSSSGNSCEEDTYERSSLIGTSSADLLSYANGISRERSSSYGSASSLKGKGQTTAEVNLSGSGSLPEYSESFIKWVVTHGNMLAT